MKKLIILLTILIFVSPVISDPDRMGSIEADATDDYCEFTNVPVGYYNTFYSMTIDFWFYPIAYGGIGYIAPISKWESGSLHWFLWVNNGDGKMAFGFPAGNTVKSASAIDFNTWQHWTMVYEHVTQQISWYKNGIFDGGGISTVQNPLESSPIQILGRTQDNLYGSARYDNMRMWKVALSSGLIEGLPNITYYGQSEHLRLNLLFNEESGAIIDTALGFKTDITNYTFTRDSAIGIKQLIGK